MIRHLGTLPRRPGCGAWPSSAQVWTPAALAPDLAFEALAANATLSGANVTSLANVAYGSAGAMTSGATARTVDSSVLQGTLAAIRTAAALGDLHVSTGGPSGTGPFYQWALASMAQPTAGNDTSFMQSGTPGSSAGVAQGMGIGCTATTNGQWLRFGGFQNPLIQGPSQTHMVWDAGVHLYEMSYDGTTVRVYQDGGLVGSLVSAVNIIADYMGFVPPYPGFASYASPDARVYNAAWVKRDLTATERAGLCRYIKTIGTFTPMPFVVGIGDSRTAGHIVTANTTSYLEQVTLLYGAGNVYTRNEGISSQTTTQIRARAEAAGFFDPFAPPGFRKQVLIIRGRQNDGTDPAQSSYDNLAAISALAQSYGYQTIISTELGATGFTSGNRTLLAEFNALVLANSCGANGIADIRGVIAGDPLIDNPTGTDMLDGVHENDTIIAAEAVIYKAAADALP